MYTLVVLSLLFITIAISDDDARPGEITLNGTTLPLRDCRGPAFSSHDDGLIALAAVGVAMLVFWLLTMLLGFYYMFRSDDEHEHKNAIFISWLLCFIFLLLGVPMVCTGFYYGSWEKVYDVSVGCYDLPRIYAPFLIPETALVTPVNFTVVYVGDSSVSIDSVNVWQMVKGENPDLLVHLGDYDYCDDPTLWGRQLKFFLGEDFPIIPVIGNHELHLWGDYASAWDNFTFWQDFNKNDYVFCEGVKYVNYWCIVRGVFIAFSAVGTKCGGYYDHSWHELEQSMMLRLSQDARFDNPYLVCAWHKNYDKFQLASDRDEVGYTMYDICSAYGALTVSGHDHTYGRTHVITRAGNPYISQTCDPNDKLCVYDLRRNGTIVTVSGKGGWDSPDVDTDKASQPWWAKTSLGHQGFGALFCKYNLNGEGLVYCYWKDSTGVVLDEFTFRQKNLVD